MRPPRRPYQFLSRQKTASECRARKRTFVERNKHARKRMQMFDLGSHAPTTHNFKGALVNPRHCSFLFTHYVLLAKLFLRLSVVGTYRPLRQHFRVDLRILISREELSRRAQAVMFNTATSFSLQRTSVGKHLLRPASSPGFVHASTERANLQREQQYSIFL